MRNKLNTKRARGRNALPGDDRLPLGPVGWSDFHLLREAALLGARGRGVKKTQFPKRLT
jgi:hypothetical protein